MALGKKAYPKSTVKKIIKAHSDFDLKKNADVTVSYIGQKQRVQCHDLTEYRFSLIMSFLWKREQLSPLGLICG